MSFGLTHSLYNKQLTVPLQNVSVEAYVVDMIAEVKIAQTYKNVETNVIQATYKFPINEAAAVCTFEAEIDGKKVQGVVKEAQEAVTEYNNSVEKGHGAFLLEERQADIFECSVGNILPEQIVTIRISYVTELKHDADTEKIRFILPTAIAPKYGVDRNVHQEHGKFGGFGVPLIFPKYELSLSIECKMTSVITNIESPSHFISCEVNINGNPKISRITLGEQINYLDKDFVLIIKSLGLDQPRAFIEYDPEKDTNCLMLTLVPKFAMNPILKELIFIVDRSGSMDGSSIKKASSALELLLRSLPEDCYFNIVSFGERFDPLFKQSEPNSPSSLSTALFLAHTMTANYGGTEIYQVLKWVFENKRTNLPTAIILLTDGNVWNVEEISELVKDNVRKYDDNLRLFALGIGSNVSSNLVESLARSGKGYAQFVTDTERMDDKLLGMLKNCIKPPIQDYKITWTDDENVIEDSFKDSFEDSDKQIKDKPVISFFNDDEVSSSKRSSSYDFVDNLVIRQAPYEIPQIYPGVRFVVYCMIPKDFTARKSIILSAMSQDGPMKLEIPVDPIVLKGSKIHTLAARRLIQDLEDGTSYIHNHPKFHGKIVPASIIRKQIVTLGKTFNLASKYTSFLAIDEREDMDKENKNENVDTVILLKRIVPNTLGDSSLNVSSNNQSSFGQSSQPSSFGQSSSLFGQVGQRATPTGFGGFGQSTQPTGFGFGQSTQPTGFGFGQSTRPTGFGFGQSTQPTGGFGFGQSGQPAGGFGFGQSTQPAGGFGFGQSTQPTGGFGFGQSMTQASPFGGAVATQAPTGFGVASTSVGGSGFGFGQSTTQASPFGGAVTTQAPTGFGAASTSVGGFGFGQSITQASPFGGAVATQAPTGFGVASTSVGGFGFGQSMTQASPFGAVVAQAPGFASPLQHSGFASFGTVTTPTGFGVGQPPITYGGFGLVPSLPSFGLVNQQTFDNIQNQSVFGGFNLAQSQPNYGGFGFAQTPTNYGGFNLVQPQPINNLFQSQPTYVTLNQNRPVLGGGFGNFAQNALPFGLNAPNPAPPFGFNTSSTISLFDSLNTTTTTPSLFVTPSSALGPLSNLVTSLTSLSLGAAINNNMNNMIKETKPFFGFEVKKELGEGSTMLTINGDDKKFDPKIASDDGLMSFLKFQSYDGIVKPTLQFYSFFSKSNPMQSKPSGYDDESWCTSIFMAYLEIVMWKDYKQQCEMCHEKAEIVLKRLMKNDDVNGILEEARNWINEWLS